MKQIETILNEREIEIRASNTQRIVKNFENDFDNVNQLGDILFENPFMRFILQAIAKEGEFITFNELYSYLDYTKPKEKEQGYPNKHLILRTLSESPLKKMSCQKCGISMHSIESTKLKTLPEKKKCPECKSIHYKDNFRITDDWNIGVTEFEEFIKKLDEIDIIKRGFQMYCPSCEEIHPIYPIKKPKISSLKKNELINYINNFYCPRCKNLGTIQEIYAFTEHAFKLWETGLWLEWYVKKILKNSGVSFDYLEQGVKVQKNKKEYEVDVFAIKNKKIISVECKDIKIGNKVPKGEVGEILKFLDFSDAVVFVTCTIIKLKDKQNIENICRKLKKQVLFIEGHEIEKLPTLLKNCIGN